MSELTERLDKVKELVQDPDFLEGRGLSNEVNIRIFCYEAKDEMVVRHFVDQISSDTQLKCHLVVRNLYDVFLDICEEKRILKAIPGMEEKKGSAYLLNQLQKNAGVDKFVTKMQYAPHEKGDVILVTGVGEVYPFMRIHVLLEKMQRDFSDVPILVMYPGEFDGRHVKLFDQLPANDYYRAFNVV